MHITLVIGSIYVSILLLWWVSRDCCYLLQIRYDSFSETILIPLTVHVEVSFVQLEVITRNVPIEVEKLMGVSTPISNRTLEFAYDRETETCKVRVLMCVIYLLDTTAPS